MRKSMKWFLSASASFVLAGSAALPTTLAQETNWQEVFQNISEANTEIPNMNIDGTIQATVENLADVTIALQAKYNIEPDLALDATGSLTGEFSQSMGEGEPTAFPLDFSGQVTIVDGVAYLFDSMSWTVEDISAETEQIKEQINEALNQVETQVTALDPVANAELSEKYYDLSETDTEYVMILKDDINSEEFWADIESQVDMEAVKTQSLEQSIAQAETLNGEPLSDEEKAELEAGFDQGYELGKKVGLEVIDGLEIRYAKDTHYITYVALDILVDDNFYTALEESMGEAIPEDARLDVTANVTFNFTEHGQVFDITPPANAPSLEEAAEESAS